MKNKISTLAIAALFSLATVSANASPNYCIISDNSTDCSLNPVDLTSITTGIVNTGDILGDGNGWWAGIFHSGELPNANPINGITNSGTITGWVEGIGIYGNAVISGGITNNSGATISGFRAIATESTSSINFINNAGLITGFNQNSNITPTEIFSGIYNEGTIGEITNTGTISSTRNLDVSFGILNNGTITTLNNSQGASGSALTLAGALPTNYNIIINSPSEYGQLSVTNGTGSMAFGINDGSTIAANTIYNNVLTGLNGISAGSAITGEDFTVTGATGIFNGLNYSLAANLTTVDGWDLVVGSLVSPVPEADTSAMLLTGLGLMGFMARRRKQAAA